MLYAEEKDKKVAVHTSYSIFGTTCTSGRRFVFYPSEQYYLSELY